MGKTNLALLCLALPCLGTAAEPRYTYVDASYQIKWGNSDVAGDGWVVGGSVGLGEHLHLLGSYADVGLRYGLAATTTRLGVGTRHVLDPTRHLVVEGGWTKLAVDSDPLSIDADDRGFFAAIGGRSMVTPKFEVGAMLTYTGMRDSGGDTSVPIGLRYHLTPNFALNAGLDAVDIDYSVGLRYYF
jgi:hypothetical protein